MAMPADRREFVMERTNAARISKTKKKEYIEQIMYRKNGNKVANVS